MAAQIQYPIWEIDLKFGDVNKFDSGTEAGLYLEYWNHGDSTMHEGSSHALILDDLGRRVFLHASKGEVFTICLESEAPTEDDLKLLNRVRSRT